MLGTSLPINLIRGSMMYFYVQILGMSQTVFAAVYVIYGIIDAIDNPVFGYLSDRTRSRWGRRRPYLAVGAVLVGISTVGLFTVPERVAADAVHLVIWFAVFAIISEMADSLVSANYGALLPELFPRESHRSRANVVRQGFQLVAMVAALGLTPWLARDVLGCDVADEACADPTAGYSTLAWFFCGIAVVVILFTVWGVTENPAIQDEPRPRWWASIGSILSNRHFWAVGVVSACYGGAMALVLNGLQMYVDYVLGAGGLVATVLQLAVIATALFTLPLWLRVIRAREPRWLWVRALGVGVFTFLPLLWVNQVWQVIIVAVAIGAVYSAMLATNDLMVARVLDLDAKRSGLHREGIFLSVFGILGRIGGVLLAVSAASLTWIFGFESGMDPGPYPDLAWRTYMGLYPAALLAVGAFIARWVRFEGGEPNLSMLETSPERDKS